MVTGNTIRFGSLWLASLALIFSSISLAAAPPEKIQENALNQINALVQEKASWTPAQRKMDSQLIHAVKKSRGEAFAPAAKHLRPGVAVRPDGRVLVDIQGNITPHLTNIVEAGGGTIINSFPQGLRALVRLERLEALAALNEVTAIRRAEEPQPDVGGTGGRITSQGDVTHRASEARSLFGVSGAGIKVGVLSDSVDFLTNSQAACELGPVTVLPGQAGAGTGEGTAMLEIIHDLAPGAELLFATANGGVLNFSNNIIRLLNAGCNIIVDDIRYPSEAAFQDGPVAQAVNSVIASGSLYFASAGNVGNEDKGTSSTWEGDFVDGGPAGAISAKPGRLHDFGGSTFTTVTVVGDTNALTSVQLFWSDPLGASTNDYDLFALDSTGSNVVASSTSTQAGASDPYEQLSAQHGDRLVVVKATAAADRFLHLDTSEGGRRFSLHTAGRIRGHAAALDAFAIAAVNASNAFPNPFSGGASNPIEPFSSDGLRRMFYNANGSAITPADFSSTGGAVRQKPDAAAADGVSTSVPGFETFFGTSAAAPHAAAIAALVWSFDRSLTASEVRNTLLATALDIEAPGVDRDSGYGILMAFPAVLTYYCPLPPTNDQCAGAIVVSNFSFATFQRTAGATSIGDPTPSCICSLGRGVWYQFTPPVPGELLVDTLGSTFDTGLVLYRGSCDSRREVLCNDNDGTNRTSLLRTPLTADTSYYLLAGGFSGSSGILRLHLSFTPAAPVITRLTFSNGTATAWVPTEKGAQYVLWFRDLSNPATWQALPSVGGIGNLQPLIDPDARVPNRIYRVEQRR